MCRDNLCKEQGRSSYKCGGHWSKAACKWRWQERARAWDIDQVRLYTSERRTMEIALHLRRLEIYNEGIEMCLDTLRAANLSDMTQAEARAVFGQMSRFFIKLLREERIECEAYCHLDEEDTSVHITADDLIAAQRAPPAPPRRDPNRYSLNPIAGFNRIFIKLPSQFCYASANRHYPARAAVSRQCL